MNTKSLMQEKLAAVDRQLIAVDRTAFLNSGITGTVCICRQPSFICRQIHTVQQDDVLSAAICRQVLLGCRQFSGVALSGCARPKVVPGYDKISPVDSQKSPVDRDHVSRTQKYKTVSNCRQIALICRQMSFTCRQPTLVCRQIPSEREKPRSVCCYLSTATSKLSTDTSL
ncbi:hypothetical protein Taro_006554, partial [Colocasia esculenta]|nr:hypothetical protein [Colocasia esculenta]